MTSISTPKAIGSVIHHAVSTPRPAAPHHSSFAGPIIWLIHYPYVIPIIVIGAYFGLRWYWPKLEMKYNMNRQPLAPWKDYIKRIRGVMFHEDFSSVITKPQKLARRYPGFTWQQYWRIFTGLVIADIALALVIPSIPIAVIFILLIGAGFYGSRHIKGIFAGRMRLLMQMAEVAAAQMKYPGGWNLNPWGWVQITSWAATDDPNVHPINRLYTPGQVFIMYPPKWGSDDKGNRDAFERNFNGTVSDQHTWMYEWESSNNRVICSPVPYIPIKTVQYPFPDRRPWNQFPLGEASGGKVAVLDVSTYPHCLIAGVTGSGKAIDIRYSIPTPTGWTTMGKIKIGDYVFDENGKPTKVVGVSEINNNADLYRVKFSDDSYVDADAEHLWRTETRQSLRSRWEDKSRVVVRRSLITTEGIDKLKQFMETLSPTDEVTLEQISSVAGIPQSPWFLNVAKEVGHVGEIRLRVKHHYKAQIVHQNKELTRYPAKAAWLAFAEYIGNKNSVLNGKKELFLSHMNLAQVNETVTSRELVKVSGLGSNVQARRLLTDKGIKGTIVREIIELDVPERVVEKLSKFVKSYNGHAIINAVLDRIQIPANDQRRMRTFGAVRSTLEIMETLKTPSGHLNHSIPMAKPLDLPDADLPIHPYLLGVFLGDGFSRQGSFCGIDPEMAEHIKNDGYSITERTIKKSPNAPARHPDFRIWTVKGLRKTLAQEGLLQQTTEEGTKKHIPEKYLRASISQRRMLLAGLLDTDGTVSSRGAMFYNTNPHIAFGAYELAISLGYRATIREGRSVLNGKDYGSRWEVFFTCSESPFRLSRKTNVFNEHSLGRRNSERIERRSIKSVTKIPSAPARCIMVEAESKMFLAGRAMIPTRNSVTQRTILMHVLQSPEWRIALVDPKRVELSAYRNHPNVVAVATELEESTELIENVERELQSRYIQMQKEGVNYFKNLKNPPPAFLLMVDETFALLAPEKVKNDEGKARDDMHARITLLIGSIARLGRAAGVHMILATQRPDAAVIPGETKALCIDTPVIGPLGWTTIEKIKEGDYVFDASGSPVKVLKATEIMYDHECYEIEFSDGEKIIADAGHLWESHNNTYRMSQIRAKRLRRQGKTLETKRNPIIVTTKEMSETLVYHGKSNHAILVAPALELPEVKLPISPYLMGCWIGDGYSREGKVCGIDHETIKYIVEDGDTIELETTVTSKTKNIHPDYRIWKIEGLKEKLNVLGLIQKTVAEGTQKRIPEIYLRASIKQRTLLLQGLMDTDGHYAQRVLKNGSIANSQAVFNTCLEPLSQQVLELVRSLGYRATINTEKKRDAVTSKVLDPVEWVYHVKWTPRESPFRLSRKSALLNGKLVETERTKYRYVVAVRPVPSVPVKCIAVDSDSHLFLAGKAMIPTHNSNLDARIAQGRMDTIPSNMTLDSDHATRIPNVKGRAILRTGNDFTEFQAYFLPEQQLDQVLEMATALATGMIQISAFDDDEEDIEVAPPRGRFNLPKLPHMSLPHISLPRISGLANWIEGRRAVAQKNDARSQEAIEGAKSRSKGGQKGTDPKGQAGLNETPKTAREPRAGKPEKVGAPSMHADLDINEIADAAKSRQDVRGMDLALDRPGMVEDRLAETLGRTDQFDDLGDYGLDDLLADIDSGKIDLEDSDRELKQTSTEDLSFGEDEGRDDFDTTTAVATDVDPTIDPFDAEEAAMKKFRAKSDSIETPIRPAGSTASISVEDVLRSAAERGIPIPASELLKALKYEASILAQGGAPKPLPIPLPSISVPMSPPVPITPIPTSAESTAIVDPIFDIADDNSFERVEGPWMPTEMMAPVPAEESPFGIPKSKKNPPSK